MILGSVKTYSEKNFKNKRENGQIHITKYLQLGTVEERLSLGIRRPGVMNSKTSCVTSGYIDLSSPIVCILKHKIKLICKWCCNSPNKIMHVNTLHVL